MRRYAVASFNYFDIRTPLFKTLKSVDESIFFEAKFVNLKGRNNLTVPLYSFFDKERRPLAFHCFSGLSRPRVIGGRVNELCSLYGEINFNKVKKVILCVDFVVAMTTYQGIKSRGLSSGLLVVNCCGLAKVKDFVRIFKTLFCVSVFVIGKNSLREC